jgi:hypothetical protein
MCGNLVFIPHLIPGSWKWIHCDPTSSCFFFLSDSCCWNKQFALVMKIFFFRFEPCFVFFKLVYIRMDQLLTQEYQLAQVDPGNYINEHVVKLAELSSQCTSVISCGAEQPAASWALLYGLSQIVVSKKGNTSEEDEEEVSSSIETKTERKKQQRTKRTFTLVNDTYTAIVHSMRTICHGLTTTGDAAVDFQFKRGCNTDIELFPTDLLFINTTHTYGHLKRELTKLSPLAKRFIVMHNTSIDGEHSEAVRRKWRLDTLSEQCDIPVAELIPGLWLAIEEFLKLNAGTWKLMVRYTNCNGLTVLQRVAPEVTITHHLEGTTITDCNSAVGASIKIARDIV